MQFTLPNLSAIPPAFIILGLVGIAAVVILAMKGRLKLPVQKPGVKPAPAKPHVHYRAPEVRPVDDLAAALDQTTVRVLQSGRDARAAQLEAELAHQREVARLEEIEETVSRLRFSLKPTEATINPPT